MNARSSLRRESRVANEIEFHGIRVVRPRVLLHQPRLQNPSDKDRIE